MVLCGECVWWSGEHTEWRGLRPCQRVDYDERFEIGGGDCNDGLYTKKDFGCVAGQTREETNG